MPLIETWVPFVGKQKTNSTEVLRNAGSNAASVFKIFWFHLHFQSDFKNLASENRDSSRIAAPILLVQIELGM
jgi:hypothetical protein